MERRIVIPGELITEKKSKLGNGVFKEEDKIYASVMGLLDEKNNFVRVIPFTGKYIPKEGDFVIGKIKDSQFSNWSVNVNSAYPAILNSTDYFREIDVLTTDLGKIMSPGIIIYSMVREVTPKKKIYVTLRERGARVLKDGTLFEINPAKVPRVIGRKSSMIRMIKKELNCDLLVGLNGWIWVRGKDEFVGIAERVFKRIEDEAHTTGLTDKIKNMITEERKNHENRST